MRDEAKRAKDEGYKILVVCLPLSWDTIYKKFFLSWINVFNQKTYSHLESIKVQMAISINDSYPLPFNRTKSIDDAIEVYGADYIMTIDADMTYPQDLIGLMLHGLGKEYKVKAGLYFKKAYPFMPVVGRFSDWDAQLNDLKPWLKRHGYIDEKTGKQCVYHRPICHWLENIPFEVDVVGTGCMAATADVFSKISRPYFDYTPDPKSEDKQYPSVGSDVYFSAQLKKAGIKILCDPRVKCGHMTACEVVENDFFNGRDTERITDEQKLLRIDVRNEQERSKSKWLTL